MTDTIQAQYARLLIDYCLEINPSDKLYVKATMLAEPLLREVYRHAMRRGAHVSMDLTMRGQNQLFYAEANAEQLTWVSPSYASAIEEFDAFLMIRAPYNLREDQAIDPAKRQQRAAALRPLHNQYNKRTADRSLRRCLCQYPTEAAAQEAGMSLEDYERFLYGACKLFDDDPAQSWLQVRERQQGLVDMLNGVSHMRFTAAKTDLTFSVKDRIWINSDGRTNMPSGEVFTAPVEDSVEGVVHFDYPSIFLGQPVQGITLTVEGGEVVQWEAEHGQSLLDQVFAIEGARRFGEVAIGTNYDIQQATHNILFDEKIGGTIHMAVGQSYIQTGGKNHSAIHWDMISEMKDGGQIHADDTLIYQDGRFV